MKREAEWILAAMSTSACSLMARCQWQVTEKTRAWRSLRFMEGEPSNETLTQTAAVK